MILSAFELVFKIGNDFYSSGTIRARHDRSELFFHFPWGSRKTASLQEIGTSTPEHGCMPDHISFHSDGTVHTKARDGNKRVKYFNKLDCGTNLFNLPRGQFVPIYLESLNIRHAIKSGRLKQKSQPSIHEQRLSWDLSGLQYFSIILVSKCARIHPERLLGDHGFQMLRRVGRPKILADIFTAEDKGRLQEGCVSGFDTQLMILIVEECWSIPAPPQPASTNGPASLVGPSISMPPMVEIARMKNLNEGR